MICEGQAPALWSATGTERPIFHDPSGRRGRLLLAGALLAIVASAFAVAALLTGAIGFTHLPPLPEVPGTATAAQIAPRPHRAPAAQRRAEVARLLVAQSAGAAAVVVPGTAR